jgi:hypothetical protein
MLRFLVLGFAVLWAAATIGRFSRRLGRGPALSVRAPKPTPAPAPRVDRLIGVFRVVIAAVLITGLAVALFTLTNLPDIVVVLITAPVAGLVSSLLTEWFVTEDTDPTDH